MQDRIKEIQARHEFVERKRDIESFIKAYPKGMREDFIYILAALKEAQAIITTAREELTRNCMFFASEEYKTCPRDNSKCHMKRTCEALLQEDRP